MPRLAIFGGTFNPVHYVHLLIAQTALTYQALDQVIWIPTVSPPHKSRSSLVDFKHRAAMVQLAIASNPAFLLWCDQINQSNSSDYAIETFEHLQKLYPSSQWYWIVGLDAFNRLHKWYQRERLIPAVNWLIAPRLIPLVTAKCQGESQTKDKKTAPITSQINQLCEQATLRLAKQKISIHWEILPMPLSGISSSLIRQYCQESRTIRYLVPEVVQAYIAKHQLYKKATEMSFS